MKHIVLAAAIVVVVGFGVASSVSQTSLAVAAPSVQPTTLEGCLRPGARDGEFALAAGGSEYLVMPGIGVELTGHVNQQVQLTGSVEKGSRGNVLRVSAVRMVAESCPAS